jgi:hypothetical protein
MSQKGLEPPTYSYGSYSITIKYSALPLLMKIGEEYYKNPDEFINLEAINY